MKPKINIKKIDDAEEKWQFFVTIEDCEYMVTLEEEYWKKLTNKKEKPEKLIERSFKFLLKREPKEAILRHFDLELINQYFPEYEEEITK